MAQIDDAEAVAFRIGQDDEVGIVGIEVPVDAFGTKCNETLDLARLFRSEVAGQSQTDRVPSFMPALAVGQ